MKKILSIDSFVSFVCLTSIILLSGCEPIAINSCEAQTDERIRKFREYCYDTAGNVILEHPNGYTATEWMIPVERPQEVHTIFYRLTGLEIHFTEHYNYSYHSEDYRYVCQLSGKTPSVQGKYATLHLRIEGCPEITAIHFQQALP